MGCEAVGMTDIRNLRTRPWLGLFAVLTALIMNILDSTIVTVAAPSIQESLGGSYASIQWLSAGYTLALATGLLTGGRLGDMFGRRRVLLVGVCGFVAASLACAFAPTATALIGARVLQGLFGAVMVPQGFGLIRDLFPPQQIGKAFGALGPVIGLSTILGPIVAGVLIDADVAGTGWRAVFLINLPMGAFAFLAGRAALPVGGGQRSQRLDVLGMLIAGVGMFLLVYPLVQGRDQGWPPSLFAMLGAAVVVLAGFVVYQLRRRASGRTPLVELSVFAKRSYASGVVFVIVFFGSIVGFSLSIGLFLQLGLGYSPMRASLTTTGWAVGAFLGSGFAATTMGKLGRKLLHIGLIGMAIGLVGIITVLSTTEVNQWTLLPALLVYGAGMGMIFVPLFDIIMGEIGDHEVGSASSMLESLQQMGASLGVAVLGTVFLSSLGARPLIGDFVGASRIVAVLALGLVAVAFALAFRLPRSARGHGAPAPDADNDVVASDERVLVEA
jgi:EmrB/QacA subfamily drug resistance transporter